MHKAMISIAAASFTAAALLAFWVKREHRPAEAIAAAHAYIEAWTLTPAGKPACIAAPHRPHSRPSRQTAIAFAAWPAIWTGSGGGQRGLFRLFGSFLPAQAEAGVLAGLQGPEPRGLVAASGKIDF
jgi:hypothetical protein